jgi:hypothetical protein
MPAIPDRDEFGTEFAKWLAPYLIKELQGRGMALIPSVTYDESGCRLLVRELGVNSLNRAGDFFAKLEADGAADSTTMAIHLGVGTPRNISSALTTPVKRVSRRLGFTELPWSEDESAEGRTLWRDRDGIAARMRDAVIEERHRRHHEPAAA